MSEAFIKDITGTDVMSARFMRGEWFDFTPECKITLGTNHKPLIRGSDEAIWNRIKLFPFTVIIPPEERDLGLFDRLLAELPGILAWAVKGCLDWQRDGLGNPDAIREATASYRNDMDTFGLWLDECCDLDTHAATPVSILYASYEEWMDDAGEHVPSKRAFGLKMQERGFTADRSTAARRWQGVKLKRLGEPTLLPVATPAAAPLEVDMGRVRTRTSGGGFTRDA